MMSVTSVLKLIPPITVSAIGIRVSLPGPSAKAGGIAAARVAVVVMRMGLSRMGPASRRDSYKDFP